MANNKKSKKKKNNYQTINWKHVGTFGAIAILVIAVILIIVFSTREHYYDCEKYADSYGVDTTMREDDILSSYSYYRLYLNEEDNTFTLKYLLKDGTKSFTDKGTFVKKDNKLTLTYDQNTQEYYEICEYTIDGDYLKRSELVPFEYSNGAKEYHTITQIFKYK